MLDERELAISEVKSLLRLSAMKQEVLQDCHSHSDQAFFLKESLRIVYLLRKFAITNEEIEG